MLDVLRPQHDLQVAAGERTNPPLRHHDVAGRRRNGRVDVRGGTRLGHRGPSLADRREHAIACADLRIALTEAHRDVDDRQTGRPGCTNDGTEVIEQWRSALVALDDTLLN